MRVARLLAFLFSSAVLACISARAQQRVTVPLVVTEGDKFAEEFPVEYLTVTEDKKPCGVVSLEFDRSEPLYVAVLMEYSRHLPVSPYWHGYYFPMQEVIYQAGMVIYSVASHLGDDDRMALVLYGNRTHLKNDFSENRQEIIDSVEDLLNDRLGPTENEATLYSSVVETLAKLKGHTKGRKVVLLVLGTGQDTFGGSVYDDAAQAARESGVQVVFVQLGWDLIQRLQAEDDKERMRTGHHIDPLDNVGPESEYTTNFIRARGIAQASGGFAVQQYAIMQAPEIAETVALWAHSTHRLTYEAPDIKPDGKLHKVKVAFNRKLLTPDGKEFKASGITVDGRRVPKPKKEKKIKKGEQK